MAGHRLGCDPFHTWYCNRDFALLLAVEQRWGNRHAPRNLPAAWVRPHVGCAPAKRANHLGRNRRAGVRAAGNYLYNRQSRGVLDLADGSNKETTSLGIARDKKQKAHWKRFSSNVLSAVIFNILTFASYLPCIHYEAVASAFFRLI